MKLRLNTRLGTENNFLLEQSPLGEHHCIWLLNNWPLFLEGDIQLVDGPTSYEGHLQVFSNGQWAMCVMTPGAMLRALWYADQGRRQKLWAPW